jgi:hypothetical protein
MTAELGTMMPDMGGPIVWVDRAFGRRVAHSNAIIRLVANFFDLGIALTRERGKEVSVVRARALARRQLPRAAANPAA